MAHKTRLNKTPLRVEDLPCECRIVRYTGSRMVLDTQDYSHHWEDQDPYELSRLSYGDLRPVNASEKVLPTDLVELPMCSGSDYSGTLVERSNHRVLLERYGDLPGVWDVRGGHGTYALVVALTQTDPRLWDDVRSMVDDYPLLDEDDLSELEREDQDSQWESWARHDFVGEVSKQYRVDLTDVPDADLRALFETTADGANIYWEDEGYGSGMYIDVDRVTTAIMDRARLLALPGAVDEDKEREEVIAIEVMTWHARLEPLSVQARREDRTASASGGEVPIMPSVALARAMREVADKLDPQKEG